MGLRDAQAFTGAAGNGLLTGAEAVPPGDGEDHPAVEPERPPGERPQSHYARRSGSHHGHRHHGQSSSTGGSGGSRLDRQRRQTLIARVIAVLAIAVCVVLSMMLIRAKSQVANHNMQTGTLASELNRTQSELTQTKQLVAAQEVELGALLKQRIPGVTALETEKLNDINKRYVKKLMFSESGTGDAKHLTYNIVLKNGEDKPITPAVTILLFDRKGLQTGVARVTAAAATVPSEHEQLQAGETRTYSAVVERIRDDPPAYYLVEVR